MPTDLPAISMTTFIDFVAKSGTPKATVVRNHKYRPAYHPSTDYYKALREAIVAYHTGGQASAILDQAVERSPRAKRENYRQIATHYQAWSERTAGVWKGPPVSARWTFGKVSVRVNPEVTLKTAKELLHIKLFMKAGGLKRSQANLLLELMTSTLARTQGNASCVVLDARSGKEFSSKGSVPELHAQLKAEAAYWATLWELI